MQGLISKLGTDAPVSYELIYLADDSSEAVAVDCLSRGECWVERICNVAASAKR